LAEGRNPAVGPLAPREREQLTALYGPQWNAPLWVDASGRPSRDARDALALLSGAADEGLDSGRTGTFRRRSCATRYCRPSRAIRSTSSGTIWRSSRARATTRGQFLSQRRPSRSFDRESFASGKEKLNGGEWREVGLQKNRRIRRCPIKRNWVVHPLLLDRSTTFAPAPDNIGDVSNSARARFQFVFLRKGLNGGEPREVGVQKNRRIRRCSIKPKWVVHPLCL
jgi:hypothetical protein